MTDMEREINCGKCGLSVPRDQASAMEILRLGLSLVDGTWPSGAACPQKPSALADGVVTSTSKQMRQAGLVT